MKRILLTVAVAAMLVLAGCNGGGQGTASPTANGTASGTPGSGLGSVATPEPVDIEISTVGPGDGGSGSVSPSLYPPGVSDAGVNETALLSTHLRQSFRNAVIRSEFVTAGGTTRFVYANGSSGERFRIANTTKGTAERWWRSGSTVVRWNGSASPSITYSQGRTRLYTQYSFLALVQLAPFLTLNATELSVDGTTTVGGERLVRLSVESFRRNASGGFSVRSSLSDPTGYVLVTPEGIIREMHYESTNTRTGGTQSVTVTVSGVGGTTVTRPDWARGYPTVNVSTTGDGRVLAFEHRGGAAIPADTRLQVGTTYSTFGNVTLGESLEPGETLYLVATGSFGDYNVTASVGSRPDVPENAVRLSRRTPSISVHLDGVVLQYAVSVEARSGSAGSLGA